MALYIRDPKVSALARELARRRRQTVTEVVGDALRQAERALDEERAERDRQARTLIAEIRELAGGRPISEDILYDENGNPIL